MTLQVYNTLNRKKEKFIPLKKNQVGLYTCGPTVYNYAHIGNLRSYVFSDVLKRVLLFNDLKVKHVMNITDVGHLTSDADVGEDKMLKAAKREKKTVWDISKFYTKAFKEDIDKLNIVSPDIWCKATDHIKEQIDFVKVLEKKGFTYSAGGNVYFDTSKLKDYGKLALLDLKAEKKARVKKDLNKKNIHDFVLWFTKSKFQEQDMKWNSPWGRGYPGWHLECSAMSMKYLGKQFDIHCGGIDHINIHHTNEIAQSESYIGKKPWVKYWLHNEFLVMKDSGKMAKSKGNFIKLSDLEKKGFSALDYRYFCLGTHYRKPLFFSWEALEGARNTLLRLKERILDLNRDSGKVTKKYLDKFTKQINDDLNTPKALATLWEVLKDEKLEDGEKYGLVKELDKVLGLGLFELKKDKIPKEIFDLAKEREKSRKEQDWKKADKLRDSISKKGYLVEDTKEGFEIKKK